MYIKYLFILQLMLFSCHSNQHKFYKLEVLELNFYSSSGGDAIFKIKLKNDTLDIYSMGSLENDKFLHYQKIIKQNELQKLNKLISKLKPDNDLEQNVILDSWRIELIINNKIFYNKSSVKINDLPNNIQKIFSLLTKDSSVKIILDDW